MNLFSLLSQLFHAAVPDVAAPPSRPTPAPYHFNTAEVIPHSMQAFAKTAGSNAPAHAVPPPPAYPSYTPPPPQKFGVQPLPYQPQLRVMPPNPQNPLNPTADDFQPFNTQGSSFLPQGSDNLGNTRNPQNNMGSYLNSLYRGIFHG